MHFRVCGAGLGRARGPPTSTDRTSGAERSARWVARVGLILCLLAAAIGVLRIFGLVFRVHAFTAIIPSQPPMAPNAALALALLGFGAALRYDERAPRALRILSLLLAVIVLLIAVLTLAEYTVSIDLR